LEMIWTRILITYFEEPFRNWRK